MAAGPVLAFVLGGVLSLAAGAVVAPRLWGGRTVRRWRPVLPFAVGGVLLLAAGAVAAPRLGRR
ncbi:hypothetical protein [Amycolatopsis solani]|uniref:hypothetical protein n=1 Tax=Amycolatopsis solani TaxID=3028615 RepID=UPI0025B04495|nr:hypothetical protein [Amycolatopsis sp. MEP2-6]